jgi:hypothetical protein
MSVIAESQSARAVRPESLLRFLRRNEDRLFIAGLLAVAVAITSLAISLSLAGRGGETGACYQHMPSMAGHVFLTMH